MEKEYPIFQTASRSQKQKSTNRMPGDKPKTSKPSANEPGSTAVTEKLLTIDNTTSVTDVCGLA